MTVNVRFAADISVAEPAPAIAMIEIDAAEGAEVLESEFALDPNAVTEIFEDVHGNSCRRLMTHAGKLHVEYTAVVETVPVSMPPAAEADPDLLTVPSDVLLYTLPSRYCPSDEFAAMANDLFGNARPGRERVADISRWINAHVQYAYGTSNVSTSARDTVIHRTGVCRDFAHLGITFCRALNIPARYVSGYCLGLEPQDLHAYFQAFVDGAWIDFDPTSPTPRRALLRIAAGRDAADCAWWTSYDDATIDSMAVNVACTE